MTLNLWLRLPLVLSYALGLALTLVLVWRRRNLSSVLGLLGFFLLLAVQALVPFTTPFAQRLQVRGVALNRAVVIAAFADLVLNLISSLGVLSIVGAIALASRREPRS
jgi:peptidoglycan/LPS O-acetylase OafA/YrhL